MKKIFIYDEFSPEDNAMLQALYSRSSKSVIEHVEKLKKSGSGKFMEKFYVGYGHSSIADCGSTTIFIENISILADKAIQDWPLYSGQETSTRYIDMSKQAVIDPLSSEESSQIIKDWMDFYTQSQEELKNYLRQVYPKKESEDENIYSKAIDARSFDILRGFLPAGITTQLSWHTNLRQAWDKIALLQHHPLGEVRDTANEILSNLKIKYNNSFSHIKYEEQQKYWRDMNLKYTYHDTKAPESGYQFNTSISNDDLKIYEDIIEKRPIKTNLPYFLGDLGLNKFNYLLDYGSFRDIQRHRSGVCRMPLLTVKHGFNSWYLEQLPDNLKNKAQLLINKQVSRIESLDITVEKKQYYISLGFNVSVSMAFNLPASVYLIELRSGRLVHPSLRKITHLMHKSLINYFPNLKIYSDLSLDDWDIRRGQQDIQEK